MTEGTAIPRRPLGSTGVDVSAIGLGGWHLAAPGLDEAESLRIIRTAMDAGIDFLDNCWDYNDGESERRMGKALAGGYRDRAFVMTKIDGRDRASAARQIDESLQRLRTDRIDLMQFHEIIRSTDPDRIFAVGGAMEAVIAARDAGKIRFVGFTGHKSPKYLRMMLDAAERNGFAFDAVQMPLNVMDAHFDSFETEILPLLIEQRIGVLGMKPLADGYIPRSGTATAVECLHYAMNLATSTVITGCESMERLEQAIRAGRTFRPLQPSAVDALLARTAGAARDGANEPYKTTGRHDGTEMNPHWLG